MTEPPASFHAGDLLKISVAVDHPGEFTGQNQFAALNANASASLILNERTQRLEGLFRVPEYAHSNPLRMGLSLLKDSSVEHRYVGGQDFAVPEVADLTVQKQAPIINRVRAVQVNATLLAVAFEVSDPAGVAEAEIIASGQDDEHAIPRPYAGVKTAHSCTAGHPVRCSVSIPMPETIPGWPDLRIDVVDHAGNRATLSSSTVSDLGPRVPDFVFSWPSRRPEVAARDQLHMRRKWAVQRGRDVDVHIELERDQGIARVDMLCYLLDDAGREKGSVAWPTPFTYDYNPATRMLVVHTTLPRRFGTRNFGLGLTLVPNRGERTILAMAIDSFDPPISADLVEMDTDPVRLRQVDIRAALPTELEPASEIAATAR
jgi:hypothetical protein